MQLECRQFVSEGALSRDVNKLWQDMSNCGCLALLYNDAAEIQAFSFPVFRGSASLELGHRLTADVGLPIRLQEALQK